MKFIDHLTKEQYQTLYNNHPLASFMQMYDWGQVVKQTRQQTPIYVGLMDDDGVIIAGALLLKKATPLKMCYFYCPRGFIIDFKDTTLMTTFTKYLKEYLKSQNAIYLKVDPELAYQQIDENAKKVESGYNNYDVFTTFTHLGYTHCGFDILFAHNQPRYTFRRYFKNYPDIKSIEKSLSKTFMNTVKRSYKYNQEIVEGMDPNAFYELAKITAEKDGFSTFTREFYNHFFEEFHKLGKAKIFNAVVYPDKILEDNKKEVAELKEKLANGTLSKKAASDAPDVIRRLEKDIKTFEPYAGLHPDGFVVASLMCSYSNTGMYTLYLGNNNLGLYTFSINRIYYEVIVDCFNQGLEFMDLFGTVGDPHIQYKNLATLHEYKRKFGDEYIEFIGEFDLIMKPFWYKTLPKLLKIYRKVRG